MSRWLVAFALSLTTFACDKGASTRPPQTANVADAGGGARAVADPGGSGATAAAGRDPSLDEGARTPPEPSGGPASPSGGPESPSGEPESPRGEPESPADPSQSWPSEGAGADSPAPAVGSGALQLPAPVHRTVKKSCGNDPGVGTRLKGFTLPTTEPGKTYSDGTFRGRVLLVNFWATWCKPCLKELPKFAQLYRRYRKHGLTLLAISTDEDPELVKTTLAKRKIAAKVVIGAEKYAGQYASPDFPFTFIVDHQGVIRASYFGYEPDCMGKLEADIRELLDKRHEAKNK